MQVTQDGHGVSNQWCRVPEDEVPAHSSNTWHIADNTPPVTTHIVYRLHNGDEILFQAQLRKPEGTRAGCSFVTVVRTPRQYECKAEVTVAGPDVAYVKFIVLARPPAGPISRVGRLRRPEPWRLNRPRATRQRAMLQTPASRSFALHSKT